MRRKWNGQQELIFFDSLHECNIMINQSNVHAQPGLLKAYVTLVSGAYYALFCLWPIYKL